MKTESTDLQTKNSVGAFTSSVSENGPLQEGLLSSTDNINHEDSSITDRLNKIIETVPQSVKEEVPMEPSVIGDVKDYTKSDTLEGSLESVGVITNGVTFDTIPQRENSIDSQNQEVYNTISGGPETLKEIKQKNASAVIENGKYSTIGMPTKPTTSVNQTVEESSLFVLFCKVTVSILFLFLSIAFATPVLLPFLVDKGYLDLVSTGVYSAYGFIFSSTISEQIPYLTSLIVVVSFVILFISWIVDLLVGKSIFLFAKVFIFIFITLLLGVTVFYLQINGTDILGLVNSRLQVFR